MSNLIPILAAWRDQAVCREEPDIFFDEIDDYFDLALEPGRYKAPSRAAHICKSKCPVRSPCLDESVRTWNTGIWAGYTTLRLRLSAHRHITDRLREWDTFISTAVEAVANDVSQEAMRRLQGVLA
jgi:hypothetical protein